MLQAITAQLIDAGSKVQENLIPVPFFLQNYDIFSIQKDIIVHEGNVYSLQ